MLHAQDRTGRCFTIWRGCLRRGHPKRRRVEAWEAAQPHLSDSDSVVEVSSDSCSVSYLSDPEETWNDDHIVH